jgi:hypothetical protein
LVDIALKLSDAITMLRKDNKYLDVRLGHISATECRCRMSGTPGATCHEALPPAANANEPKSYRDVLTAGSAYSVSHPANRNNPGGVHMTYASHLVPQTGICNDGFTTAIKKTRNKPGNIRNIPNSGIHKSRPAMIEVRNSISLAVITQKPTLKSLFVSRLGPVILASDVKDFLHGHVKLTFLSCTLLNTEFYLYSYFHVSVTADCFLRVYNGAAYRNCWFLRRVMGGSGLNMHTPLTVPTDLNANRLFHEVLVLYVGNSCFHRSVRIDGGGICPSEEVTTTPAHDYRVWPPANSRTHWDIYYQNVRCLRTKQGYYIKSNNTCLRSTHY